MRLFCLPYAGGNASIFYPWSAHISSRIAICPIELPGRGSRHRESLRTSLPELVDELAIALEPYLNHPYALLGHSMGGVIATQLASKIEQAEMPPPSRLFVLGMQPLHLPRRGPQVHRMNDDKVMNYLRELGGTSKAVLDHPELMQFLLPIFKADLQLIETSLPITVQPLRCGLSVSAGEQDPETDLDEMRQWHQYTLSDFKYHVYPGDHFFPWRCTKEVLRDLTDETEI